MPDKPSDLSDLDQSRARLQRERLRLSHEYASERREQSHELGLRREEFKIRTRKHQQELAIEGNLEAMKLAHDLDLEVRERDFADLVREEDLRLQALSTELSLQWLNTKSEREIEHKHLMEALKGELIRIVVESNAEISRMEKAEELEEKLLLFKAKLALKFGSLSEQQIDEAVEKLIAQGKL